MICKGNPTCARVLGGPHPLSVSRVTCSPKSYMQIQAHRRPISSGKTSKTEVGPCNKRPVSIWPSGEQLTPVTAHVNSQKLAVGKSPAHFFGPCAGVMERAFPGLVGVLQEPGDQLLYIC